MAINGTKGLTAANLKIIACVTMFIDHFAAIFVYSAILQGQYFGLEKNEILIIYKIMRGVGRIAFPIFCFMLVEGFKYTRSRWKYLRNLLIFGLISEIPFDIGFKHSVFDPSYNNIFFTLALGMVSIWMLEVMKGKYSSNWENDGETVKSQFSLERLRILPGVLFAILAPVLIGEVLLNVDYGGTGVICIILIYLMSGKGGNNCLAMLAAVIVLVAFSSTLELAALIDVLLIYFYNGQRGKQIKYFFYGFYPGHIALICLITILFGIKLI